MKDDKKISILKQLNLLKESSIDNLIYFHQTNKYLFMMFDKSLLQEAGNILGLFKKGQYKETYKMYSEVVKKLITHTISKKQAINTCEHMFGYFKNNLNKHEKEEYLRLQFDYKEDLIPLSVLLMKLKSYAVRFNQTYLLEQSVLNLYIDN